MKIEEAIEWMEETIQDINELFDQCSTALQEEITEQKEVFELALTALRSMQEAGEPIDSPPAHIDRRAWTAEWVPTTDDDGCVWLKCSACEYDLDSMEESNPFCPSCGRAMTEEAWAELKRRVRR